MTLNRNEHNDNITAVTVAISIAMNDLRGAPATSCTDQVRSSGWILDVLQQARDMAYSPRKSAEQLAQLSDAECQFPSSVGRAVQAVQAIAEGTVVLVKGSSPRVHTCCGCNIESERVSNAVALYVTGVFETGVN